MKNTYFNKNAGLSSEILGQSLTSHMPYVGGIANIGGAITAGFTDTRTKKEQKEASKEIGENYIPSRGIYNFFKRTGRGVADSEEAGGEYANANNLTEYLTPAPLVSGGVGAILGGTIGREIGGIEYGKADKGELIGAGLGAVSGIVLPVMAAGVLALMSKTRTVKDQAKKDKSYNLGSLLIPGVGEYNKWKRLGSTKHYDK